MVYELILAVVILLLLLLLIYFYKRTKNLKKEVENLKFNQQSSAVKHGQAWENFVPFMPEFEKVANKDNFTFIGMPIDGICFDEEAIKFIEIKTGKSQLSQKQKHIKELINAKQVQWHELNFR